MKRIGIALAVSLLLHLLLVTAPAWRLPAGKAPQPLQARLVMPKPPPPPKPPAAAKPPPAPKPAPKPRRVAPKPRHLASKPRRAKPSPPRQARVLAVPATPTAPALLRQPLAAAKGTPTPAAPAAPPTPAAAPAVAASKPAPPSHEAVLPSRGEIHFSIMSGDQGFVIGKAVQHWVHDRHNYEITSVTQTTGLVALFRSARVMQTSMGMITADGLKPLAYRVVRDGVAAEQATFDWPAKIVRYSGERKARLRPGSQDILSVFYQLGEQGVHALTQVYIATGKKYARYTFSSLGQEQLATPFGKQRVLHLRTVEEDSSEATEIWVGLDLHDLPLKVRYTDRDGNSYQQVAVKVQFDKAAGRTESTK